MGSQSLTYSPFDRAVIDNPYPTYRKLRDEAPAFWSAQAHCWVLSRHVDVSAALHDPVTFSSAAGIYPTPPGVDMTELFLPMLIMSDPPRHSELRHLVGRAFTPRRIAGLDSGIHAVVRDLLAEVPRAGPWDFVDKFSGPLPAIVIADMLGVPRSDREQFRIWSTTLIQSNPIRGQFGPGLEAAASLYDYFSGFLAERRAHPQDDLMTALVQAEVDGERLDQDELLGFCLLLLVAGHETTTNLLSNSAVILSENHDSRRRLSNNAQLVPSAVEELLRFDSPVQGLSRTLTTEIELHGQIMRAGETVLLLFGSANRDETVFPESDVFTLDRGSDRQVAFGHGIHFCLGAALARMETRIALQALLDEPGFGWNVDHAGATRLHSGPIRGYASLPVS